MIFIYVRAKYPSYQLISYKAKHLIFSGRLQASIRLTCPDSTKVVDLGGCHPEIDSAAASFKCGDGKIIGKSHVYGDNNVAKIDLFLWQLMENIRSRILC